MRLSSFWVVVCGLLTVLGPRESPSRKRYYQRKNAFFPGSSTKTTILRICCRVSYSTNDNGIKLGWCFTWSGVNITAWSCIHITGLPFFWRCASSQPSSMGWVELRFFPQVEGNHSLGPRPMSGHISDSNGLEGQKSVTLVHVIQPVLS